MAKKTRDDLKASFRNGTLPDENVYKDLIDSLVNKLDDQFFGLWKQGTYRNGDVVIWHHTLYVCIFGKEAPSKSSSRKKTTSNLSDAPPFCSVSPPDQDQINWELIRVQMEDNDWEILASGTASKMRAKTKFVGIGTNEPKAELEVANEGKTNVRIKPSDSKGPLIHLSLEEGEDQSRYLKIQLENEEVKISSDAPKGYSIEQTSSVGSSNSLINAKLDVNEKVSVGIGTKDASSTFEVEMANKGKFQANVPAKPDPNTVLVDTSEQYLSTSISNDTVCFIANTPKGYVFKSGIDYGTYCKAEYVGDEHSLLIVTNEAKVGIGKNQDSPEYRLEAKTKEGELLVNLGENGHNPVISLVNKRNPSEEVENHLNLGLSNQRAIIATDAPQGFILKKEDSNKVAKVEAGVDAILQVKQNKEDEKARVAIGKTTNDVIKYELDVNGATLAFNYYIPFPRSNVNAIEVKEITEEYDQGILDNVCSLKPLVFKWAPDIDHSEGKKHFGLSGEETIQHLGAAVDEVNDTISYANIVPALVQSIKELRDKVSALATELEQLKK